MPVLPSLAKLRAWHVVLGLLGFRLLFLPFFCHLYDLAGDESYYWEWGRRLDWGYYSKPPLIGWLMGLVGRLSGDQEWAIRLAALLCGTASLLLIYQLGKTLYNAATGLLALLLAALTPANVALHLFFTIDAPLILLWSAALLAYWRASQCPDQPARWLLLTGLLGLGCLSKQMMLVFPLLMVVHAIAVPEARQLLRSPWYWMSMAGGIVCLLPVVWWNQQHDWITLEHTRHHFNTEAEAGLGKRLVEFLEFPASQAGLLTPVTWFGLLTVGIAALLGWRRLAARERFLVLFSAPALVVFHLLALRQGVNPNWPAVYYLSATVLLAAVWTGEAPGVVRWPRFPKLRAPALGVATVLTAAAFLLPVALWALGKTGEPKLDPMARLHGWSQAGGEAGRYFARMPRPENTFVLALGHRENASQFAFYMPQHPRTYRWQPNGVVASQYELWPTPAEGLGRDALILQPTSSPLPKRLERNFAGVEKLGEIEVPMGRLGSRKWQVFRGRELLRWETPPPASPPPTAAQP